MTIYFDIEQNSPVSYGTLSGPLNIDINAGGVANACSITGLATAPALPNFAPTTSRNTRIAVFFKRSNILKYFGTGKTYLLVTNGA
jgi:hypothetical protein